MSEVFADTSYFIALLNPADEFHHAAAGWAGKDDVPLLTTSWIVLELGNFFSRPQHRASFVRLVDFLRSSPRITLLPPEERELANGISLFSERADQTWSLTDCISFSVMRERGISEALTSDHHFDQAGFVSLLREHP